MRLLHQEPGGLLVTNEWLTNFPKYAVLSHTWLSDKEEIKLDDVTNGTAEQKPAGYSKIQFCGKRAAIDGYKYFWVDTCCIDKTSSAELQEAITAMFRWYRNAGKCYAYLSDVSVAGEDVDLLGSSRPWEGAFRRSRWFTRGWTLQELLAPAAVEFYSAEGIFLGDKISLKHIVHEITGIPLTALEGDDLSRFSASERLSWAKHRRTTRVEDQAYCLLGVLEIHMPLLYGEDEYAMVRLQQEVQKKHGELAKWDHLLETLPIAPQAAFNSLDNQYGPTCLTNTRVELLRDLMEWADAFDDRYIYWLNGIAGTGKSTVARTIARNLHDKGILGGSFFFSKGGGDVSRANLLFTTLASQLASRFPSAKRHICEAILANKDIAVQSLRDQWDQLIISPLAKMDDPDIKNIILVLDALDECDSERDIRIILRLMSTTRVLQNVRLRVFVTSRPEIPIRCGFLQIPEAERQVFYLHEILPKLVDRDLNLFFQQNFTAIGEERGLGVDWPGSRIIERLVEIAYGLFIWASTACRYIREGKGLAIKRLATLIKGRHSGAGPERQLDAIYTTVLEDSIQQGLDDEEKQIRFGTMKEVVGGIVTLLSPLSASSLAALVDMEVDEINETLADLHTIFNIPSLKDRPIRLHHPTFRDFLVDSTRCKNPDVWIDQKKAHKALADSCIRIMRKTLKRDICDLKAPGVLAADIDQSRKERCIPPELQYSCLYWAQHYRQSGVLLGEHDTAYAFLKEHYLHWLEVMNIMGRSSEIAAIIRMYQALLVDQDNARQLSFLKDARRFIFSFQNVMERTPLQTYCAGLAFVRPSSELNHYFRHELHPSLAKVRVVDAIVPGHKDEYMFVNDLAFTPDGSQIASASLGPVIRVWDIKSKAALLVYDGQRDKTGTVAISPDGKTIASGSDDTSVMVWNRDTRVKMFNLEGHTRWVNTVVYSPDGSILASGSMDETIRLWDAASGTDLKTFGGNLSCVNAIAFSPDGKFLVSATFDWLVRVWDVSKGEVQLILDGHSGPVNTVRFSPNGQQVVSGSDDMTIKVWNTASGMESVTLKGHVKKVSAVTFSPDACLIVSGSEDKTLRLWDVAKGTLIRTLEGHISGINAVCFSPDGQTLAAGAYNDEIRLWDAVTGETKGKLADFTDQQLGSVLEEKGTELLVSSPHDGSTNDETAHASAVVCLTLSPDRQLVASASQDSDIKIWTTDGNQRAKMSGHVGRITRLMFHPDGTVLASASMDSTVVLWEISTGTAIGTLRGHTDAVQDIRFSPNGQLLASCSADKTVRLWHVSSATPKSTLYGHADTVTGIAFSRDGRLLVSCSADRTVRLWNVETAELVAFPFAGHEDTVNCVALSPSGTLIASCSSDTTIRLWPTDDLAFGTASCTTADMDPASVTVVAAASGFFSDTACDIASGGDEVVRFWPTDDIPSHTAGWKSADMETASSTVGGAASDLVDDLVSDIARGEDATARLLPTDDNALDFSYRTSAETGTAGGTVDDVPSGSNGGTASDVANGQGGVTNIVAAGADTSVARGSESDPASVTILGHEKGVNSVSFSPDGQLLVSSSDDHTVRFWDCETRAEYAKLDAAMALRDIRFSADHSIESDRGALALGPLHLGISSLCMTDRECASFVTDEWITKERERMLWLPDEYRASSVVTHGGLVILGHASGGISFISLR
ncbi:hypothetical protein LTR35_009157 [Friedmanniomyces endolithicus]|nr:hypothetical protein LTR35_009157 [Friedmanniomyces endolithicus]KAK0292216.1 hypothetical protein LTS00_008051 [Friedmanniomyces endolithicus]